MVDEVQRTLKIKTGVVKRLAKELTMYGKEADNQRARIEKMRTEGKDEYDIKKQHEVLQETLDMLPDVKKRLDAAEVELRKIVEEMNLDYDEVLKA
eukprot:Nk52_evm37s352 gene=Nk52_evmTU37s352